MRTATTACLFPRLLRPLKALILPIAAQTSSYFFPCQMEMLTVSLTLDWVGRVERVDGCRRSWGIGCTKDNFWTRVLSLGENGINWSTTRDSGLGGGLPFYKSRELEGYGPNLASVWCWFPLGDTAVRPKIQAVAMRPGEQNGDMITDGRAHADEAVRSDESANREII